MRNDIENAKWAEEMSVAEAFGLESSPATTRLPFESEADYEHRIGAEVLFGVIAELAGCSELVRGTVLHLAGGNLALAVPLTILLRPLENSELPPRQVRIACELLAEAGMDGLRLAMAIDDDVVGNALDLAAALER